MNISVLRLGSFLLSSIQTDLTDLDAMQFQNNLLGKIVETGANGIVIDITSMEVVDSFMARVLNDTASMARLLGAEVVICGIRPFVAMTLIEMGRDLIDADCCFNLDQALSLLEHRVSARGDYLLAQDEFGAHHEPH